MKKRHHKKNQKETHPGLRCKGRIWIESGGNTFLGFGRVVLLERIQKYGSISKAALSMEMSYKHAWDLIDSMNRQAGEPLITTWKGGKGGGGAKLTDAGEKAIELFGNLHERLTDFLEHETRNLMI